jgi:hypothetical protein
MLKGTDIYLVKETITGYDDFNQPIVSPEEIKIEDCLVGQPTTDDITTTTDLYGKKIAYVIGIPKSCPYGAEYFTDAIIKFNGDTYKTIGKPLCGIPENIPLRWAFNVKVECYGED